MKLFEMPERLMEEFGCPEVTREVKAKIFGLNAARLYDEQGLATPSNRRYGPTTRREFFSLLRSEGLG